MGADGSVYQRKDGRWVDQYRDAGGKVRYIYRKSRGKAKQALRDAVRARYIRTNPIADVKPPRAEQKDKQVLTAAQVKQLLRVVRGDRFEGVYVLGATCALRIGEALAIRAEDVDFAAGTLQVRRTVQT